MRKTILAAVAVLPFIVQSQHARGEQLFIRFEGVPGESTDEEHMDWSDIDSFGVSVHRSVTRVGSRLELGSPIVNDITVTKLVDKASVPLWQKTLKGEMIPTVEIDVTRPVAGSFESYARWEFKNVYLTSYASESSLDGGTDHLTFSPGEMKYIYKEFDAAGQPKGTVEATWDVAQQQPALLSMTSQGVVDNFVLYTGNLQVPESSGFALTVTALISFCGAIRRGRRNLVST